MPCPIIHSLFDSLTAAMRAVHSAQAIEAVGTSALLVAAAEFGDKSQMVAMALASRHRHWPVFWGATLAFSLLNVIAVLFGSMANQWLPAPLPALLVSALFLLFGLRYLLDGGEETDEVHKEKRGHGVLITTFMMIFLAELGDKTQFAVAGLSASEPPFWVWVGSTLGLSLTSGLGIWAGRMLYRRLSPRIINRCAGILFILFAGYAFNEALREGGVEKMMTAFDLIRFSGIKHDGE